MSSTQMAWLTGIFALVLLGACPRVHAGEPKLSGSDRASTHASITDTAVTWPTWSRMANVFLLREYNTRVVILGVTCLGLSSGVIGSFMLLRKRALLSDALSHATLPGIGIAFMVMNSVGGSGKWLPGLLLGATATGVTGICCILVIVHLTRTKEDAALGIVLSVFFGMGVAVLGIIQNMGTGSAAGLESFIYGKTASMLAQDAALIAAAAVVVAGSCIVLFKELALLCFDTTYAASLGRPVVVLDVVMMTLVVGVTVIGLQAVGLILMVALLIIPPAAARFWTNHLPSMVVTSAIVGAASGLFGAGLSALTPRLPAGAVIVVIAGMFFGVSMIFGPARGILPRIAGQFLLNRKVARQHLLRALYELSEGEISVKAGPTESCAPGGIHTRSVPFVSLLAERSWSPGRLRRTVRQAARDGLVQARDLGSSVSLTPQGTVAAWRVVRNHRLWEMFLMAHADIAPSHVDRDADEVEHVLEPTMIQELEAQLARQYPDLVAPSSPHRLQPGLTGTALHRGASR